MRPPGPVSAALAALSAFFAFGALASGVATGTLVFPGTALDLVWRVNPRGHAALLEANGWAIALMAAVCVACSLAAAGIATRAAWARHLAIGILIINLAGDTLTAFITGELRTLIGIPIAGALIVWLASARVRSAFASVREAC